MQQGKQDVGLGDSQVRGWRGWHPHMALVMMAMLFLLEERQLHHQTRPLLSGRDIRALLNQVLPRRDIVFPIDIHTYIIMQWTLEERHIEYLGVERRIEPLPFAPVKTLEKNGFFDLSLVYFLWVVCPVDDA